MPVTPKPFDFYVEKVPFSECWYWTGYVDPAGYGTFQWRGKSRRAHRVSYELAYGTVPPGHLSVCHKCDTPSCVRPDHLFMGTQSENALDAARKGRLAAQKRTHCLYGHPLSGDNLVEFVGKNGRKFRNCRECIRGRNRDRMARQRRSRGIPERQQFIAERRLRSLRQILAKAGR